LARLNAATKQVQTAEAKPAKAGPSLSLDHYAGDYTDPGTGRSKSGKRAAANDRIPAFDGNERPLTHYQYDTFKTNPSLK
jgi:hypothetical protein